MQQYSDIETTTKILRNINFCLICDKQIITNYSDKKHNKTKFCSKDCYKINLSNRNKKNNCIRNKNFAEQIYLKLLPQLKIAAEYYKSLNNIDTLKIVANKHNIPHSALRKYCVRNNLIRNDLLYIHKENNLKKKFPQLTSDQFFIDMNKNNLTCKEASKTFGISPNTIAVYARKFKTPIKNKSTSSYEREIKSYLKELNINYEENKRILNGKEIDIFVSENNLGIEINGCYWHTEKNGKDKNYHLNKHNLAKEKGIELLQFYDNEIDKSFDIVKSILSTKLGKNNNIIQARKLNIKEISKKESEEFLNNNHLHGYIPSSINIGGYYNDKLVCVLSFNKTRFSKKYELELTRFAIQKFTSIRGAFEKLFSFFIKNHKPQSIISYCHIRLFSGQQYFKAGFNLSHTTPPGYFWYKPGKIVKRYQSQKHKLNTNLTEKQYMENQEYSRVWDCGQKVFVWNNAHG